jgi:hypothetical protein
MIELRIHSSRDLPLSLAVTSRVADIRSSHPRPVSPFRRSRADTRGAHDGETMPCRIFLTPLPGSLSSSSQASPDPASYGPGTLHRQCALLARTGLRTSPTSSIGRPQKARCPAAMARATAPEATSLRYERFRAIGHSPALQESTVASRRLPASKVHYAASVSPPPATSVG